jgi:arylsulfatase A-like enzyme
MASRRGPVLHGALVGAIAGALAAIVDGVDAWSRLAQFAPSAATRARTLAYLASTYALAGALAGLAVAAAWRCLAAALAAARPHGRRGLVALAVAIAPACGLAAWLAHRGLARALAHRKHHGLMVAASEAVTIAAMLAAIAAGVLAAGAVLHLLRGRTAAAPPTPPGAAGPRSEPPAGGAPVATLATVLAFLPLLALAIGLTQLLVLDRLTPRHTPRQVVTAAVTSTVAALAIACALATGLSLALRRTLGRIAAGRDALARAVAHPAAAGVAAWIIAALAALALLSEARPTLALVRARPLYVAVLAVLMIGPAWPLARRLARPLAAPARRRARRAATALVPLGLLVAAAVAGSRAAVVKAAVAYSGGGDVVTRALTRVFDVDRDGHSPWFGGDDCDDLDPEVHPGASDIPDDGVDQNCVAGDARLARTPDDVGMIPLPPGVPADASIVLLTIDTLRADHLGSYGYRRDTSPNLDALAAEGARFAAGWAHAPSTRYSMPAILTGRLPLQVDYDTSIPGWPGLLPRATTIAEVLAARGFTTAAFTNYWYFDPVRRMNQGFAIYDNENARLHQGADPAHTRGSSSKEQTDKALAFLADHAHERFFLWVHYYDVHHAYEPRPEVPPFGGAPLDRYDGEIRFTDLHVGRLFADLRARGLWDRTVIVVTGDHGEGFGEHGIHLHGYDLYAPQTKVPLIIRVPGLAPRVVTTAAGHVDILPTLANLAGAPATREMMGSSLLGWIAGSRAEDDERAVFQQVQYEGNHDKRGAASARCHVLYDISPHTSWQLYDLERDPGETRDLSGSPGRCAATRRAFERWFDSAQIPAGATEALLSGPPDIARPLAIDLGPEVRLLAVELPAEVVAGQPFDIAWTFAARGRLADGWKVFVHFEGARGARFTADHPPARPFAWWRAGQYVRYTITATVPATTPAGDYALWTGLWKKQARRPVTAPADIEVVDDRVKVATLRVVRPPPPRGTP